MSRHRSLLPDSVKEEFARELGVYDTVRREGWGAVSARNCGNLVRLAIEKAGRNSADTPE